MGGTAGSSSSASVVALTRRSVALDIDIVQAAGSALFEVTLSVRLLWLSRNEVASCFDAERQRAAAGVCSEN